MKRPTKRKMYQKRRKKEKAEQRKKVPQSMPLETTATTSYKYNNNTRNQYKLNTTNNHSHRRNVSSSKITSYSKGLQLWWQTYCSAIEFHTTQQNTWQADTQDNQLMLLEKYANEYDTSSEEEEGNDVYDESSSNDSDFDCENNINAAVEEFVDEDYLTFLEITRKHQEELRLQRAEDNC